MSELSLIEFIRRLFGDGDLREQFAEHPQQTLNSVGLGTIDAHDVKDALTLVREDSPDHDHDGHAPEPHHHESAAEYVNRYIHNEFVTVDETNIDNSFHQDVDTHGGDFDQDLDYHPVTATGGGVAAGGDIRDSTITTGDGNQVGEGNVKGDGNVVGHDNNAVTGDHSTAGFGTGNVSSTSVGHDLNVGDGSAFATGGAATVNDVDNSAHDSFNQTTDESVHDSFKDQSDHSVSHSDNTETDNSQAHSHNTDVDTNVKDSFNDESDNSQHLHFHV